MPTVVIGDNTGDDYTGNIESHMRFLLPLGNYFNQAPRLSNRTTDNNLDVGIIAFPGLSNIPASSTVNDASFHQYLFKNRGGGASADVQRVLKPWLENTVRGDRAQPGVNWDTLCAQTDGVDRDAAVSGVMTMGASVNQYIACTGAGIVADVQAFVDGSLPNYGWVQTLAPSAVADDLHEFRAREATDGQRPYLVVTFDEVAAHDLSVADAGADGGVDVVTAAQTHLLTVAGVGADGGAQAISIAQVHELSLLDVGAAAGVDTVAIDQAAVHDVSVADVGADAGADVISIAQTHALSVPDAGADAGVDAPSLGQAHVLDLTDVGAAAGADSVALIASVIGVVLAARIESRSPRYSVLSFTATT